MKTLNKKETAEFLATKVKQRAPKKTGGITPKKRALYTNSLNSKADEVEFKFGTSEISLDEARSKVDYKLIKKFAGSLKVVLDKIKTTEKAAEIPAAVVTFSLSTFKSTWNELYPNHRIRVSPVYDVVNGKNVVKYLFWNIDIRK